MAFFTPSTSSPSLPNFTSLTTIKLETTNFLTWAKQLTAYLNANGLFGFVDGPKPRPREDDSVAYLDWFAKDNMVVAILISSLTAPIMAQVLDCSTAQDIWRTRHELYSARSSAQIVQTRLQLTALKKGPEPVSDYYNKAKALVSTIHAAGQVVSDSELVIYQLAGLGSEYDSVVTSISTQLTLPSSTQPSVYRDDDTFNQSARAKIQRDRKGAKKTAIEINLGRKQ